MLHNLFHNVNSCLMLLSRLRHGAVAEGELGHPLKRIFDAKRDIYSEKNRFRGKKAASTRDSSAKKLGLTTLATAEIRRIMPTS